MNFTNSWRRQIRSQSQSVSSVFKKSRWKCEYSESEKFSQRNLLILFILTFVICFLSQRISAAILSSSQMILSAMCGLTLYLSRMKSLMSSHDSISRLKFSLMSKSRECDLTMRMSIVISSFNLSWITNLFFESQQSHIISSRMMYSNVRIESWWITFVLSL